MAVTGYERQSAADIANGKQANLSAIYNAEFDQLAAAFDTTSGHTHDGTAGGGQKLTRSSLNGLAGNGLLVATSNTNFTALLLTSPVKAGIRAAGSGVALIARSAAIEGVVNKVARINRSFFIFKFPMLLKS